jgi:hypothetical protein
MSNSIRAAALDAAIVEALRVRPNLSLHGVTLNLWKHYVIPDCNIDRRAVRHRLQRLRAAGRIAYFRAAGWNLVEVAA